MNEVKRIDVREAARTYIDEKEAARITGRAVQTLRNDRVNDKGFPYIKIGKSVRYNVAEILGYMEKRRVVPGGQPK